jgi:subtilase family serine protease
LDHVGNASLSQSVFETSEEYFSPRDLNAFQKLYGLQEQAAENIGGFVLKSGVCATSGNGPDCYEGNLDLQYMMGMAQNVATIYWYVGGGDPFVTWITDVADEENPPQSNSISWGSVEQVY